MSATGSAVDPTVLGIIVCPACHGELSLIDQGQELACTGCTLIYPVRGAIPVLLVDEARRA